MKVRLTVSIATLALAAQGCLAQTDSGSPLTRAEVRQQVLEARATGALSHAGDAGPEEMTPYRAQVLAAPTTTRAEQKQLVLEARANGELAHAGELGLGDGPAYARSHPWVSTLSRSDVKAAVLKARRDGTLIPAGEGELPRARVATSSTVFAHARAAFARIRAGE